MKTKIFFIVICLIHPISLLGQFFNSGQEPWRIRWQQLNSPHFRVVFPKGSGKLANRYLSSLERMAQTESFTQNKFIQKLDVWLHAGTSQSNAWMAWAPARLEVLTTPPQDMYAHDWPGQLAVHELRHAVQIESVNTSTTRFMSYLLGQQATGLALGLHVPLWLIEGDAVWSETVFSRAGRLRDPWFLMPLTTQWKAGLLTSYDKAYFGSFKDFVPDHYVLGAALVASANRRYGKDALFGVFSQAGKHFIWPGAFRKGLKKVTGIKPQTFYTLCRSEHTTDFTPTPRRPYENELYGAKTTEGHIFLKQTLGQNPAFVKREEDRTIVLAEAGFYLDTPIDVHADYVAYARRIPDLRWQHHNQTEIVLLDIQTGEEKKIQWSRRAMAPTLSPDRQKLAATEFTENGKQIIWIFNIKLKTIEEKIIFQGAGWLTWPSWQDDNTLVFIETGDSGYSLVKFQCHLKEWEKITSPTRHAIRSLEAVGDTLLFAGEYQGKGEIMAYICSTREIFVLTESEHGADYPSYDKTSASLTFSNYTLNGYKLKTLPSRQLLWQPVTDFWNPAVIPFAEIPAFEPSDRSETNYDSIQPYRKLDHIINIHSYGPVSVSPDEGSLKPGLTFMSQNLLNTFIFRGGYEYETEKNGGRVFAEASYAGLYPLILASAQTGWYTYANPDGNRLHTHERETEIRIFQPLNLSRGRFYRHLALQVGFVGQNYRWSQEQQGDYFQENTLYRVDYALAASLSKSTPEQNLFPRPGISFRAFVRTTPFKKYKKGQQYAVETNIYLPGALAHDGFRFYIGWEKFNRQAFASQIIRTPRGYNTPPPQPQTDLISLGATWRAPLFYPDGGLPGLLYVKRIHGGLFYDRMAGLETPWQSVGVELFADAHFFRLPAPANVGLRGAYRLTDQKVIWEMFVSVSFNF